MAVDDTPRAHNGYSDIQNLQTNSALPDLDGNGTSEKIPYRSTNTKLLKKSIRDWLQIRTLVTLRSGKRMHTRITMPLPTIPRIPMTKLATTKTNRPMSTGGGTMSSGPMVVEETVDKGSVVNTSVIVALVLLRHIIELVMKSMSKGTVRRFVVELKQEKKYTIINN